MLFIYKVTYKTFSAKFSARNEEAKQTACKDTNMKNTADAHFAKQIDAEFDENVGVNHCFC